MRNFSHIVLGLLLMTLLGLMVSKFQSEFHGVYYSPHNSEIPTSSRYENYRDGFTALIEKELSANSSASKPEVSIREIIESSNELSIGYDLKYTESFVDGEKTTRATTGWALLKKDSPESQWKLFKIRDASQKVKFTKGSQIGS